MQLHWLLQAAIVQCVSMMQVLTYVLDGQDARADWIESPQARHCVK